MAAKIGIFGESTVVTIGTVTTYTVPSDKAARLKFLFLIEGGDATHHVTVLMGTPNTEISFTAEISANQDNWTGNFPIATPDPAASLGAGDKGMQETSGIRFDVDTLGAELAVGFWPEEYILSTGDTVKYAVATQNFLDTLFQAVGVEDDA